MTTQSEGVDEKFGSTWLTRRERWTDSETLLKNFAEHLFQNIETNPSRNLFAETFPALAPVAYRSALQHACSQLLFQIKEKMGARVGVCVM